MASNAKACKIFQVPLDEGGTMRVVAKSQQAAEKYSKELLDQWREAEPLSDAELRILLADGPEVAVECWLDMARPPGHPTPNELAAWKARRKTAGFDD